MGSPSTLSGNRPVSHDDIPSSPGLEKPSSSDALVNASGHKQELDRQFSLLSICAIGITTGNTWIAVGGSLVCGSLASFMESG